MWQRIKDLCGGLPFVRPVSTGEQGEREAAFFLQAKGYEIVARNWRNPADRRDELDLVCRDGEALVFVEVKTRSSSAIVSGFYAVNKRKKSVLLRAAKAFLRKLPEPRPLTYRFDVVEVSTRTETVPAIRHYENNELFPKHFRP
jgi:putative endonuclease